MNVLQRFYFIILLCYPTIVYSNDLQIFTDISSLTYSGSVPIKAYTDDWKTEDFQQSDFAFSFNQATVGVKYKNWSLAWLSRYDYWLEFSEDTAELYYKTQNDQDLDANRQYQLSLEIGHQISQGWRASYEWFFNKNNSLTMAISWLKANWLIDGKINGQAVATNINDYGFDLAVDYLYSEDRLFDRVNYTEPEGHGFAVDIGLNYAVTNRWSINLFIKDAFAEIQWKNAPQTIADATTNVSIRNLDGSLNVRPIIQGVEQHNNFKQKLSSKIHFLNVFSFNKNYHILYVADRIADHLFQQVGIRYQKYGIKLDSLLLIRQKAVTLALQHDVVDFSLTADSVDLNKARFLFINFGIKLSF